MGDNDYRCCALPLAPSCVSWARGVAPSGSLAALGAERAAAAPPAPSMDRSAAIERVSLAPALRTCSSPECPCLDGRWRSVCGALGARSPRVYAARGTTHEGPSVLSWGASEALPPTPPKAASWRMVASRPSPP